MSDACPTPPLAEACPDAFLSELASHLNDLAIKYSVLGMSAETLLYAEESI